MAQAWRDRYFPEDFGDLIEATKMLIRGLKKPPYEILLEADIEYASFVNEMPAGTNWTKPTTYPTHFWDRWKTLIIAWFRVQLRNELRAIGQTMRGVRITAA